MSQSSWGEDTAPLAIVPSPPNSAASAQAARELGSALLVRGLLGGVATIGLLVAAVLMFAHSIRRDTFPGFVTGMSHTVITRYSGPWIAGAFAALLLAGVLFTLGVIDLIRRFHLRDLGPTRVIREA